MKARSPVGFILVFVAAVLLFIGAIHLTLGIGVGQVVFIATRSVCLVLSAVFFVVFLLLRTRKAERDRDGLADMPGASRRQSGSPDGSEVFFRFAFPGIFALLGAGLLIGPLLGAPWYLAAIGVVFLLVAVMVARMTAQWERHDKQLRENGRKVWAAITGYSPLQDGGDLREAIPVRLYLEVEGREIGLSKRVRDPDALIGKSVAVYLSREDPEDYVIDDREIQ